MVLVNALIILALILVNGFFAMSELAVVSSRKGRLQAMAEEGRRGARSALTLAENPGRFLSSVQIGISLVGVLAGAFGGATLAGPLAERLQALGWLGDYSEEIAFTLVVAAITYVSLIIGELVPKQFALRRAELIACWVARPMNLVARAASPLVSLLDVSTRLVLRLFGRRSAEGAAVSDEEIRMLISEAAQAGVVERAEQEMIAGVMRLADRPVSGIMTPRPDVEWIDVNDDPDSQRRQLRETSYSRLLVCDGDIDEVLGIVQAKDLLDRTLGGESLDLRAAMRDATAVPESMGALKVLDLLRRSPVHMALVVDEYGSLMGIVSTTDAMKVIVGNLTEHGELAESPAFRRADGSWLLDGSMPLDEVRAELSLKWLVAEEGYHTLAGWMLSEFDHLPHAGEHFERQGWRFEVMDMDGYRIDKVLAVPPPEPETSVDL